MSRRVRVSFSSLIGLFCLAGSASILHAQPVKATIVGTVRDSSGAVVVGAEVRATETNTNITRSVRSNESGYYVFAVIDPGVYRIDVESAGFRKASEPGVRVFSNSTARADFTLELGALSETMEVKAATPLLQADRVDTGRTIEATVVQDMPLGYNRNYQGLLVLAPGVTDVGRGYSVFYNSRDSLLNHTNGQTANAANFQVEGVDNNWDNGNLTIFVPPAEAIETVNMTTSGYDPEFGNATSVVTAVTLRSGTNNLHGSAFEFNKVSALSAKNVFATTKAPETDNMFGFALGGPIRKDKTFFFGDYQGMRDHSGSTIWATIPTMPFRTGDLSQSPSLIYDPATGNSDGTGRTPFSGNIIPGDRISPIAAKLLALVPAPTYSGLGSNFEKNMVLAKNTEMADIKIDQQFTDRDRLSIRYSFQRPIVDQPPLYSAAAGGPMNHGLMGTGKAFIQAPGLDYTHSFSGTFLTEFRFGINRVRNDAYPSDFGQNTSADLGIAGVNINDFTSGLTDIRINGYDRPMVGYSGALPWRRSQTNFSAVTVWTKIVSNHMIKFGAELRRERNDLLQTDDDPRGEWRFNAGPTALKGGTGTSFANSFASFLLDQPSLLTRGLAFNFPTRRTTALFTFVGDKWQVAPPLTLDVGLRHELWFPASIRYPLSGNVNYDPTTNSLIVGGIGNNPKDLGFPATTRSFAPRLGLSYRLNEQTVVRAGYGISYGFFGIGVSNYPVWQDNEFDAPNSYSRAASLAVGIPAPILVQVPQNGIINPAPLDMTYTVRPADLPHSYVQAWNIAVQRVLPSNFVLEVGYVGNHGVNLPVEQNINAGMVLGAAEDGQPLYPLFGRLAETDLIIGVPSSYNSLQVKLDRRLSGGFYLTTAYTYSKSIDFSSNYMSPLGNNIILSMNRGRADFDRTHVFVQSYTYQLPFGRKGRWLHSGPGEWVLGGWQVNGIFSAKSGYPLGFSADESGLDAPGNSNTPDISGKVKIYGGVGSDQLWFDTSVFSDPAPLKFGNVGRNISRGPGLVNLDFSIFKRFSLREGTDLELRMESFNFTNTPHFDNPDCTLGDSTFGQVTTAENDSRTFRLGLKLRF